MIKDIIGLFKVKKLISVTACQNVLDEISWKYTETGKNKNLCCKYWSEKAIERYEKNIKDKDNKDKNKGLVHEHVIPRNIFINTILDKIELYKLYEIENEKDFKLKLEKLNEELNKDKLDERLIACIITKEEDESKELKRLMKILDERLIACIITKEEDDNLSKKFKKTMPGNDAGKDFFGIEDIWSRYKRTGIKVYEVEVESKNEGRKTVSYLKKKDPMKPIIE